MDSGIVSTSLWIDDRRAQRLAEPGQRIATEAKKRRRGEQRNAPQQLSSSGKADSPDHLELSPAEQKVDTPVRESEFSAASVADEWKRLQAQHCDAHFSFNSTPESEAPFLTLKYQGDILRRVLRQVVGEKELAKGLGSSRLLRLIVFQQRQ
ncbi:MAG: hypothetical protein WAV20_22215 [Blastocatellia bacterium]